MTDETKLEHSNYEDDIKEYPHLAEVLRNLVHYENAPEDVIQELSLPFKEILLTRRAERDRWLKEPRNFFTENGYEIIGPLLPRDECDRLVQLADSYNRGNSYIINDAAYLIHRGELESEYRVYDDKTWQLFNLQYLDPAMGALFNSQQIENIFRQRLRRTVYLESITIQVSGVEGRNRQPWHVDAFVPTYKAFIYLTDANEPKYGPFSFIPRTHLDVMRPWRARYLNAKRHLRPAQMEVEYDDSEALPLCASKGEALIATLSAPHAGWPLHEERTRYVLVCYLTEWPHSPKPFNHGRDRVAELEARRKAP
ncbi:MAG: phytanoyl-CoA dioxygenase family protein [Alphaproteobacteria bacterium]|nr:phytanoyl-CoA dioxygenase family protein [Alphaproteobacteria bacterium]